MTMRKRNKTVSQTNLKSNTIVLQYSCSAKETNRETTTNKCIGNAIKQKE